MFGALGGVLPLRLGGSPTNGWTAAQHARVCADLVAASRSVPLASWNFTKSGSTVTVSDYRGRNGVGAVYAPNGTPQIPPVNGASMFRWSVDGFLDDYTGHAQPITIRAAQVDVAGSSSGYAVVAFFGGVLLVRTFDSAGVGTDSSGTVRLWGTVGEGFRRGIGDYAGDTEKRDSATEGSAPYAEFILRELRSLRGTAYTDQDGRLVDAENLALARFFAATGPRNAERFRANMLPGTSDERLEYWKQVLAIPIRSGEPKWRTRQRLATHYKAGEGPTIGAVRAALAELLGDVFVDATWIEGSSLSDPPDITYWPGGNDGPAELSLGGGAWLSERCNLLVSVQLVSGLSEGEFRRLLDVDMYALLDQILPAWATWCWSTGSGFILDGDVDGEVPTASRLDFDGLTDT
jgi:hypothetical protein